MKSLQNTIPKTSIASLMFLMYWSFINWPTFWCVHGYPKFLFMYKKGWFLMKHSLNCTLTSTSSGNTWYNTGMSYYCIQLCAAIQIVSSLSLILVHDVLITCRKYGRWYFVSCEIYISSRELVYHTKLTKCCLISFDTQGI